MTWPAVAFLAIAVFGVPFAWLWLVEKPRALMVDEDEQPIDTIPHVDPDYLLEHDRAVRAIQERAASTVADPGALLRVIKADGS